MADMNAPTQGKEESTPEAAEKTFTQSELDAIVTDRVRREREKYANFDVYKEKAEKFDNEEESKKSELQKAQEKTAQLEASVRQLTHEKEVSEARAKVSKDTGVPVDLLSGETEEDCRAQADTLLKWKGNGAKYASVPDSGEVHTAGGGTNREKFAEWFDSSLKK